MTLIPVLYGLGWLVLQPIRLMVPARELPSQDLIGTGISVLFFLLVLPSWTRTRWGTRHPWRELGLKASADQPTSSHCFLIGLAWAAALLSIICVISFGGQWGQWLGDFSAAKLMNALLLCFGVGLIEELLFRGWLLGELNLLIGAKRAVPAQAVIFSLVHTRFNLGFWPMLGLLIGLFLLGMALATRRQLDGGSLWGCVGLHGGLVGGWFALQSGLIQWSPESPFWLTGPGDNPLGGMVGILCFAALVRYQLTAFAKAARP